jgi:hypothetical protein
MILTGIYATSISTALLGAINTRRLAEAWAALHPDMGSKPAGGAADAAAATVRLTDPSALAFLARARDAITRALQAVLPRAWTEGWVLGEKSAQAVVARLETADWGAWKPGDWEAARAVAGDGLRQLLEQADVEIKSIASSRVSDLADVLSHSLSQGWGVDQLARELKGVLDDPGRARMVAHTEIARAQTAGARSTYTERDVAEVEILTAADDRVCAVCAAAEDAGPYRIDLAPTVPLHPLCRCAEAPAVDADLKLPEPVGASS